eukprot:TRINITY_DN12341_c0_g1_i1.p1 TRINITY_DN12341_c0_g1~~TRINITY_DN12341_c0_g1_i1.p1  ORF type:complete len:113 (+),score=27.96 TRINITY_DN12341_c0_g1_i1:139-477(+)
MCIRDSGYYKFPFAGSRAEVLAKYFQRHNRETMQATELRDIILRFAATKSGGLPSEAEVNAQLNQIEGVNEGAGAVTEAGFVAYFEGEMANMSDTDFFTMMQYFWHGYLSFY